MADDAVCETTSTSQKTTPQEPTTEEKASTQIQNGDPTTTTTTNNSTSTATSNLKLNEPTSPQMDLELEIKPIIDQLITDTILTVNIEQIVDETVDKEEELQTKPSNSNSNVILMKPCSLVPYRVSESSDSDVSDSDTEDSESDSTSSGDETQSESSCSSDGEEKRGKRVVVKKRGCVKTQGELGLDDLPKIGDLKISAAKEEMKMIGNVHAVVDKLVVVRSIKSSPPLDLDTYLFSQDGSCLGQVFEVLGPVIEPYYTMRFNTVEDIESKGIVKEKKVFYVPSKPEMTSFVFVDALLQNKGSDASWEFNNEPPEKFLDYSDDEKEKNARRRLTARRINRNGVNEQRNNEVNVSDVVPREIRLRWRRCPNRGTGPRFSNPRQPQPHFRPQNVGFRYNTPPPAPPPLHQHHPRMLFGGLPPPSRFPPPSPQQQLPPQFETSPFLFNPFFQPPPPPPNL